MVIEKKDTGIEIMERDRHRQLVEHANKINKQKQELNLSRSLKKEVNAGANGTQDYVVKKGANKDTVATTRQ